MNLRCLSPYAREGLASTYSTFLIIQCLNHQLWPSTVEHTPQHLFNAWCILQCPMAVALSCTLSYSRIARGFSLAIPVKDWYRRAMRTRAKIPLGVTGTRKPASAATPNATSTEWNNARSVSGGAGTRGHMRANRIATSATTRHRPQSPMDGPGTISHAASNAASRRCRARAVSRETTPAPRNFRHKQSGFRPPWAPNSQMPPSSHCATSAGIGYPPWAAARSRARKSNGSVEDFVTAVICKMARSDCDAHAFRKHTEHRVQRPGAIVSVGAVGINYRGDSHGTKLNAIDWKNATVEHPLSQAVQMIHHFTMFHHCTLAILCGLLTRTSCDVPGPWKLVLCCSSSLNIRIVKWIGARRIPIGDRGFMRSITNEVLCQQSGNGI